MPNKLKLFCCHFHPLVTHDDNILVVQVVCDTEKDAHDTAIAVITDVCLNEHFELTKVHEIQEL